MSKQSINDILLSQISIPERLLTDYNRLNISELELLILLQIYRFLHQGNEFPTPQEIAKFLSIDEQQCAALLRQLIQKGLLELKELESTEHQLGEAYSLEPLWDMLFQVKEEDNKDEGKVFILFEQEFGRLLSPFEIETINIWLDEDQMDSALITAALREAVLMGKMNFKYIDRILREWKKKGIKSVEQARSDSRNFRGQQVKKQYNQEERDTSVYFNWLEGE